MPRIEDYALIGDLQTAALVSREGSVDWCCFPRFDSGACFAALLGTPDHGRWLLAPAAGGPSSTRCYRHDTLILESIYETDEGRVRALDFMPPRGKAPDIVRIVEGLEGSVPMRSELAIRFDYGDIVPWVRRVDHARVAVAGPGRSLPPHAGRRARRGHDDGLRVHARAGRQDPVRAHVVPLARGAAGGDRRRAGACRRPRSTGTTGPASAGTRATTTTRSTSRSCCSRRSPTGRPAGSSRRRRRRSPSGSAVFATGTTASAGSATRRSRSLAMLNAGYQDEAVAWRQWLLRAIAGDPADVQIMYGIAGERRLEERESWNGCPGTRGRARCGSGTPPRSSSSSTSTARSRTRSSRLACTGRRRTTTSGR